VFPPRPMMKRSDLCVAAARATSREASPIATDTRPAVPVRVSASLCAEHVQRLKVKVHAQPDGGERLVMMQGLPSRGGV
jgi:hypothetical protein